MTDSEQRVVEEYFADLTAEPDPAHVAAVARMNGAAIHLRRQDLVDDDQWLVSAHVRNCRHRVGVNECLYSAIPCAEPGKYFGISLHRPWSGVPFTTSEREAVGMLHRSLNWLLEDWLREQQGREVMRGMTRRMSETLACLLEGDSEKAAAKRLGLSPHTLHEYAKAIYKQFSVRSRAELMARCAAIGIRPTMARTIAQSKDPLRRSKTTVG